MWTAGSPEFALDPDTVHDAEAPQEPMKLHNHADCVIVGAGIAGLVAANSLHARVLALASSTKVEV